MCRFLSGNLKCLYNRRLESWSVRRTLDATFLVLLLLYRHFIYFTLITVQVFMWQVRVYILSPSGEELWCVNKPGPSPNKPLLDAWCCLACHHIPCVRAQVVYYQTRESHLQHRNKYTVYAENVLYTFLFMFLSLMFLRILQTQYDTQEVMLRRHDALQYRPCWYRKYY